MFSHGDQNEKLKELKDSQKKLETEIKQLNDRWEKECELVNKQIDFRKQKFAENTKEADKKKIDGEISKVEKEIRSLQGDNPQVFADVTAITVAQVIESWTGIQVGNMTRDEMTTLLQLEDDLKKRVVGQDHAITQIADVIRGAKVGLKKEDSPIGVFIMVGTSGVGKTELARADSDRVAIP